MSFGFKKRPASASSTIIGNTNAARRLANADYDSNGNGNGDTELLTSAVVPTGRSTPKLPAPKKELTANTRVSRFGFRQPPTNRLNKVSDINNPISTNNIHLETTSTNNNQAYKYGVTKKHTDSNKNEAKVYTLQSIQLPRAQVPILESKAAKTLANNSRKNCAAMQQPSCDEMSSNNGSITEDSGVGSHTSGHLVESDTLRSIKELENSPLSARKTRQKPRALNVVVSGKLYTIY